MCHPEKEPAVMAPTKFDKLCVSLLLARCSIADVCDALACTEDDVMRVLLRYFEVRDYDGAALYLKRWAVTLLKLPRRVNPLIVNHEIAEKWKAAANIVLQ